MKKEFHISAFVAAVFAALVLSGCHKLEYKVYDNPYVYIVYSGDGAMSEMSTIISMAITSRNYDVCISSKTQEKPIVVKYQVIVGDGLAEGVDYELPVRSDTLTFNPGVFKRSITIDFKRHKVDKTKDNTITLKIVGSDPEMQIGLPGEKPSNTFHTIKKIN